MHRASIALLLLLCLVSIAIVFVSRVIVGPADLYEKDQPKTLAYTADILLHGRFALPRDVIYQPATKPPLYNWIAAGVMKVTGSWSELAMKSPSVLGAIGVALILAMIANSQRHGPSARDQSGPHVSETRATKTIVVAALSCAIWFSYGVDVRHGSVIRLMFLARPDMLQAFFLTGAWAAATIAMQRSAGSGKRRRDTEPSTPFRLLASERITDRRDTDRDADCAEDRAASSLTFPVVAFWLCVTSAILTKGPLALLALVYAALAARLVGGSWRRISALLPILGLLATAAAVGTWLFFAYSTDPEHVRSVMLGAEIVDRVTRATPEGNANSFWYAAMWFVTKGGPFSVLALLTLPVIALHKRWLRPPDAVSLGAALWLVILLVGLSVPAGKRVDYLVPTFAPAAYLAARLLVSVCRRASIPLAVAGLLPLWMAMILGRANVRSFHEAQEHWSDRAVAFAADVGARVREGEPLLVIVRGKHPITTLLHRHQGSMIDIEQLKHTRWIVLPLIDTMARPVTQSELVPLGFEVLEDRPTGVLGLFDMHSEDRPTIDELIAAQRAVGNWTVKENPYHAPGTVWADPGSK